MKEMARMLVWNHGATVTFTCSPRYEGDNNWSVRGNVIPGEAVMMCVGYAIWLKPGSKVGTELKHNHDGQEALEVTYPTLSGATKSFFLPIAYLGEFSETKTARFEERLI